jgi:hypothetical protein
MSDRPPASTPVKTKSPTDRPTLSIELCPAPLDGAQLAANFADIVATASSLGQSAIGYRWAVSGQIVVNPSKSERLRLDRADEVVVIAAGLVVSFGLGVVAVSVAKSARMPLPLALALVEC